MESIGKKSKRKKLEEKSKRLQRKLAKLLQGLAEYQSTEHQNSANTGRDSQLLSDNINSEFVEVREKHFKQLTNAIIANILETSSLDRFDVEKISLEIEQRALLACMVSPVYKDAVSAVITQVKKFTKEKKMFPAIKAHELNPCSDRVTVASRISADSIDVKRECIPTPPPVAKVMPTMNVRTIPPAHVQHPSTRIALQELDAKVGQPIAFEKALEKEVEPGLADFLCHMGLSPSCPSQFNDSTANLAAVEDDAELDHLMQILEGNEEVNTESQQPLNERLKMMFGGDEYCDTMEQESVTKLSKAQHKKINLWRNQRYIYLYKVFAACRQMKSLRFYHTRRKFALYFGEDSDYEHEDEFDDQEKYLEFCTRHVSLTAVKFIRPYYKQKRINCGDSYVFKNLVTRIASSLVNVNSAPTDFAIRRFVDKFFPSGKTYMTLDDVWFFEPDD